MRGTGNESHLEDFLADIPEDDIARYLEELLPVELELRASQGETPRPIDYESRFPNLSDVIHAVFQSQQPAEGALHIGHVLQKAGFNVRVATLMTRLYVSERPHALREYGLLLCQRGRTNAGLRQLRKSISISEEQGDIWQHALSALECGKIELRLEIAGAADRISTAQETLARVSVEAAGVERRCLKLAQQGWRSDV